MNMQDIKITYRFTLCGINIGNNNNLYGCSTYVNDIQPITPIEFLELLMNYVSKGNIVTDITYKIAGSEIEYKTTINRCLP